MARKYYAATGAFTPPATPTDLAVIGGAANRIIAVTKISFGATQTSVGQATFFLTKRSTANSGGTAVVATKIPANSQSIAAQAVVQHYTANPTTGNAVGNLQSVRPLVVNATTNSLTMTVFDLTMAPVVLKDETEQLALNFAGAALPAGMVMQVVNFEWTEE